MVADNAVNTVLVVCIMMLIILMDYQEYSILSKLKTTIKEVERVLSKKAQTK